MLLAMVCVLFCQVHFSHAREAPYATGCIPSDPQVLQVHVDKDYLAKLKTLSLPSSVDWSAGMPAPGNQGRQGSCTAWATGYALKTYQENQERQWGVDTPAHQFSPAYIYNQINGGRDAGSSIWDALNLLVAQGCDTLDSFPYRDSDYLTQPGPEHRARAYHFRAHRWAVIDFDDDWWDSSEPDMDPELIKRALQFGPVVMGANVYWDAGWSGGWSEGPEGEINLSDVSWPYPDGRHAICIVGYDDRHPTKDGLGAFKFINSWGTDWGYGGYGWMSYDYVRYETFEAEQMWDLTTTLSLSRSAVELKTGSKQQLTATARYSDGKKEDITRVAVWTSSDPAVVQVTGGMVTAVGAGKAIVTASYAFKDVSCTVTVPAPPPRNLKASTSSAGVQLTWQPPPGGKAPLRYDVYIGTRASGPWTLAKSVTSWQGATPNCEVTAGDFTGGTFTFVAGNKYYFRVLAVFSEEPNAVVSAPSNVAYAVAGPQPPSPPSNLKARTASDGVVLTWRAPSGIVPAGYLVYISGKPSGSFTLVKKVTDWEGSSPNCAVTAADCAAAGFTMVPGSKYYFQVYSFIVHPSTGELIRSVKAATAYAVAGPQPPHPPIGLKAKTVTGGVALTWRPPTEGTEPIGYQVYISNRSTGSYILVKDVTSWEGYPNCMVTMEDCARAGFEMVPKVRYYFRVYSYVIDPRTGGKILSQKAAITSAVAGDATGQKQED